MTASSTILMTGATRGIGRVAAERILSDRSDVHLVVVARGGGDAVVVDLATRSGNRAVSALTADLASLQSIGDAIASLSADLDAGRLPPLSGIVANAGLQLTSTTSATADGIEMTFGVNVLAGAALIMPLLDRIQAPGRIVLTASDVHFGDLRHNLGTVPAPRWDDPERLAAPGTGSAAQKTSAGRRAYATSKLGVVYLTHALARRLRAGVNVFSFNPGLVPGTGLVRDADPVTRFAFRRLMSLLTALPLAQTQADAGRWLADAATGALPGKSGSYIDRSEVVSSSSESYDEGREEALWKWLTARLDGSSHESSNRPYGRSAIEDSS